MPDCYKIEMDTEFWCREEYHIAQYEVLETAFREGAVHVRKRSRERSI